MEVFILFAPLIGALIAGFAWKIIGEVAAQWLSIALLFAAAASSWLLFLTFDPSAHAGGYYTVTVLRWIESGLLSTDWAIRIDRLTLIMLVVITTVSSLVHLYSVGYMDHDPQWEDGEHYKARFFAYLSFFTFTMLALVTADNLVQMFFGWEGVGVASYLLIGFYYRKPSANAAAIKAFLVNRVGDFGFGLGIFALFFLVESINFSDVFAAAPDLAASQVAFLGVSFNAVELVCFLLFIGAMGKSAQLVLHTWLPDAMEGPTPVSALIHAATMVTAGVFLVCRMSPLMEFAPDATTFITVLGASTAFFAASIGLVQTDIKRVIAYSTCSQLGYMFAAAGVGMYSVAMFHLFTHAFFKAMLFLGAGSVIHAMHHEQDMMNYGGLRRKIPVTFWAMMIGTLAITGSGVPVWLLTLNEVPIGFAGFQSKDAIVESVYGAEAFLSFWLLIVAAVFTSFYSWRLIFLTFFGQPRRQDIYRDAHESPITMLIPLGVLAIGSVFAGMVWYKSYFGHVDQVGNFFGVEVTELAAASAKEEGADDLSHDEALHTDHSAAEHGSEKAHHYVFSGRPEEGGLYFASENTRLVDAHQVPYWVKTAPFAAMLLGFLTAYWFYIRNQSLPQRLAANQRPLYLFLKNKWYFDELYAAILIRPFLALGRLFWRGGDGRLIDGGINGLAMGVVPFFTRLAMRVQSGYIFTYAFWMVVGITVLITWMSIAGGLP
ncbi:MAG: NADH-quinone oxidoreductase subunit L [Aestuariivita sp.]|nr:NADH-quinone oxidoreductase subunit L [Aestuariivita sp.]MCY4202716.1 NADH-quinone oxidoreductase subunit L [Aestuariivita sp.]